MRNGGKILEQLTQRVTPDDTGMIEDVEPTEICIFPGEPPSTDGGGSSDHPPPSFGPLSDQNETPTFAVSGHSDGGGPSTNTLATNMDTMDYSTLDVDSGSGQQQPFFQHPHPGLLAAHLHELTGGGPGRRDPGGGPGAGPRTWSGGEQGHSRRTSSGGEQVRFSMLSPSGVVCIIPLHYHLSMLL